MPALYASRSVGYVDDPDAQTEEVERYRLDEFGDPLTVVDIISTMLDRHFDVCRFDFDPLDLVISRNDTLVAALRFCRSFHEGTDEGSFRDTITDAYARQSELRIWSEPTLEELSA